MPFQLVYLLEGKSMVKGRHMEAHVGAEDTVSFAGTENSRKHRH